MAGRVKQKHGNFRKIVKERKVIEYAETESSIRKILKEGIERVGSQKRFCKKFSKIKGAEE